MYVFIYFPGESVSLSLLLYSYCIVLLEFRLEVSVGKLEGELIEEEA